jgi:hypothetical protein
MKGLRTLCVLAVMVPLFLLTESAMASEEYRARLLEGAQESPAVITGTSGSFTMNITKGDGSFDFELSYQGIERGSVTQAHLHVAQPSVAGSIVIFLCTNVTPPAGVPVPPACPASAGMLTGIRSATDVLAQTAQGVPTGDFPAVLTAIRKGLAYWNVHRTVSPSGEIPGQIK